MEGVATQDTKIHKIIHIVINNNDLGLLPIKELIVEGIEDLSSSKPPHNISPYIHVCLLRIIW